MHVAYLRLTRIREFLHNIIYIFVEKFCKLQMATPILSFISLRFLFFSSLLFMCLLVSSLNKCYAYEDSNNLQCTRFVQVSSLLPSPVCSSSTKGTQQKRASLKVFHKHGPCSPLNQHETNLTQILLHDHARVKSLQSKFTDSTQNNFHDSKTKHPKKKKRKTKHYPKKKAKLPANSGYSLGTGNYVVTIGLGTPKRDLTLIFDTGSDLTWTQCEPCLKYCYTQKEPIFDPSKSPTYSNFTCNSEQCSQLTSATGIEPGCYKSTTCLYDVGYGDKSFSEGFFGKDKLTLTATDVFDNFLFGCGQNNNLIGETAGLLGLGRDNISFVSQSAQKFGRFFSYCLSSSASSTGHLTFGKDGTPSAVKFTTLSTRSKDASFYFTDLIGIRVGCKKLSIPRKVFSTPGTIIDSGTVITRLPQTAYVKLKSAFRDKMSNYTMTGAFSILDTCYDFSKNDKVSIPAISFFFTGDVEMELDFSGILFVSNVSQICLAFAGNSDDTSVAIFGNNQQKTFDVVYDVAGGQLGFSPGGCD